MWFGVSFGYWYDWPLHCWHWCRTHQFWRYSANLTISENQRSATKKYWWHISVGEKGNRFKPYWALNLKEELNVSQQSTCSNWLGAQGNTRLRTKRESSCSLHRLVNHYPLKPSSRVHQWQALHFPVFTQVLLLFTQWRGLCFVLWNSARARLRYASWYCLWHRQFLLNFWTQCLYQKGPKIHRSMTSNSSQYLTIEHISSGHANWFRLEERYSSIRITRWLTTSAMFMCGNAGEHSSRTCCKRCIWIITLIIFIIPEVSSIYMNAIDCLI